MFYTSNRLRVQKFFYKPSCTKQSFAGEADINNLVRKFKQNPDLIAAYSQNAQKAFYGDFDELPDYREALHIVMRANEGFDALPSEIRKRFDNDPSQLLDFLEDPANLEEATKLGLVDKSKFEPSTDTPEVDSAGT